MSDLIGLGQQNKFGLKKVQDAETELGSSANFEFRMNPIGGEMSDSDVNTSSELKHGGDVYRYPSLILPTEQKHV
jgi:hypothetical protein